MVAGQGRDATFGVLEGGARGAQCQSGGSSAASVSHLHSTSTRARGKKEKRASGSVTAPPWTRDQPADAARMDARQRLGGRCILLAKVPTRRRQAMAAADNSGVLLLPE